MTQYEKVWWAHRLQGIKLEDAPRISLLFDLGVFWDIIAIIRTMQEPLPARISCSVRI